jgi:hypothetical protein
MQSEEPFASLARRLEALGLELVHEDEVGPMGSTIAVYSDGIYDIVLHNDRGEPALTLGPRGSNTYVAQTWAMVLGAGLTVPPDVTAQLDFLLDRRKEIQHLIESDPEIAARLLEANWTLVKETLGLDPTMPRPTGTIQF